jgi:2-hydroxy-6-oxonona-2,4-dienedioate hydrolase
LITYPVEVEGIATRVLASGSQGAPMLFLHGTANRADRWIRNLDAQALAGRRAYAIDLPGHGFAAKGRGTVCTVPAYAAFAARFLATIGPEPAVVVGTSLGGHVAACLAVAQPERVSAIVLVGSMGLVTIGAEARARIQAGANNQSRAAVAAKFTRIVRDQALVTPEWIEEEQRVNTSPGAAESLAQLGEYIALHLDDDVAAAPLARLAIPKLLVWGELDPVVPLAIGVQAHALLPGSRLAVVKDAAHSPYLEKADAFNQLLDDFLAGTLGRRPIEGVELRA